MAQRINSSQEQLKLLMLEKKKQRNQAATLPQGAQLDEQGLIQCLLCKQQCSTVQDFKKHLNQAYHLQSIQNEQTSKRKAQIEIQSLENETTREKQPKQINRLTKEQIERIKSEVDKEFAENHIQQEIDLKTYNEFFDAIQAEQQEKKTLEMEMGKQSESKEIEIDEDEELNQKYEQLKSQFQHKAKKATNKYSYLDNLIDQEDEGNLDWKSK